MAAVTFGGTARIARRAVTLVAPVSSEITSSVQLHEATGAESSTRSPSVSAMRFGITCEPPTTRESRQRSGSKRLSTLPAPAIVRRPSSSENVWLGFVRNPPARNDRSRSRASSSATSACSHASNVVASSDDRLGMRPGGQRVDAGSELVELRDPLGVGSARRPLRAARRAPCSGAARRRARRRRARRRDSVGNSSMPSSSRSACTADW